MKKSPAKKSKPKETKVNSEVKKAKNKGKKTKKNTKQTRYLFDRRNSLVKKTYKEKQKPLRERLKEQLKASRFR